MVEVMAASTTILSSSGTIAIDLREATVGEELTGYPCLDHCIGLSASSVSKLISLLDQPTFFSLSLH